MKNVTIIYVGKSDSTFEADYLMAVGIVRHSLKNKSVNITEISVNGNDKYPSVDYIKSFSPDLITIVGGALNRYDLEKLWEESKAGYFDLIWFSRWEWEDVKCIPGVRNKDKSMSRLAWEFYKSGEFLPKLIHHIDDYLNYKRRTSEYWNLELMPTILALMADFEKSIDFEKIMLKNRINDADFLNQLIKVGTSIQNYLRKTDRDVIGWKIANQEVWSAISDTVSKALSNE